MTQSNGSAGKSSAEVEREVNEQRSRVEARIGEIRDRLSPGQLLDEALSYTKHGGAHFASNLGRQVADNPLPAALAGIGIAWLIASSASGNRPPAPSVWRDAEDDYPYARVKAGSIRRTRHAVDDAAQWWSEFQTDSGETYRAPADEFGHRAGHFIDHAGKRFAGFIDHAGNRVRQFQDEAGNRLDESLGWASHSWRQAQHGIGHAVHGATAGASALASRAADTARQTSETLGGNMQSPRDMLSGQITTLLSEQPLIAGALAFAAGAALGAALPHTRQEDRLVGDQADELRGKATLATGDLYEQGKDQVSQAYERARETGGELYDQVKTTLTSETPVRH